VTPPLVEVVQFFRDGPNPCECGARPLRWHTLTPSCLTVFGWVSKQYVIADTMQAPVTAALTFPHKCPGCGGAAYVGWTTVECAANCRPQYARREP